MSRGGNPVEFWIGDKPIRFASRKEADAKVEAREWMYDPADDSRAIELPKKQALIGNEKLKAGMGGAIRGLSCSYGAWVPGRGMPSVVMIERRLPDGAIIKEPLLRDGVPVLELLLDPAQSLADSKAMTQALKAHLLNETHIGQSLAIRREAVTA